MSYNERFTAPRKTRYLIVIEKLYGIRQRVALAMVKEGLVPVTKAETLYACGYREPRYPLPAIPQQRSFKTLYNLGWVSALNDFDVDTVFNNHIKL